MTDNGSGFSTDGCEPISALTSKRTSRKAWDKCIEYQEKLVYPCEREAQTGDMKRANHCHHIADELIDRGVDATKGEFSHMALLGFGNDLRSIVWACGGTIISENYILTAGHCLYSRDYGPVTYALIGILKPTNKVNNTKVYKIKTSVRHPDYKPPIKYHDIALLETETPIELGPFVVPACLHVGGAVNDDEATTSGWNIYGDNSYLQQKRILNKFTLEECIAKFPPTRTLQQGFDENTQICYGDRSESQDTCLTGGSPLHIKNTKISCMYTIIGVTSLGKPCKFVGEPVVYTRVEHYTPWIESVVWRDN